METRRFLIEGLKGKAANALHNFARLHFLCTVAAEAAKFIVRVA